jgi:hypothetical protein
LIVLFILSSHCCAHIDFVVPNDDAEDGVELLLKHIATTRGKDPEAYHAIHGPDFVAHEIDNIKALKDLLASQWWPDFIIAGLAVAIEQLLKPPAGPSFFWLLNHSLSHP